jgi:dTMP kinase
MTNRRGWFITLEGGEGSGKSTVAVLLAERLRSAGHTVVLTEEPAGTPLGRYIWQYFKEKGAAASPLAELLLFEAARAEHVATVLRPALEAGQVVVSDRFADSSLAYQGYSVGLGADVVGPLNDAATGGLKPDLTLLLDIEPETGLARAHALEAGGVKDGDSIGARPADFHARVRAAFLDIARAEPERVRVIDASAPIEAVADAAWRDVEDLLEVPLSLDKGDR